MPGGPARPGRPRLDDPEVRFRHWRWRIEESIKKGDVTKTNECWPWTGTTKPLRGQHLPITRFEHPLSAQDREEGKKRSNRFDVFYVAELLYLESILSYGCFSRFSEYGVLVRRDDAVCTTSLCVRPRHYVQQAGLKIFGLTAKWVKSTPGIPFSPLQITKREDLLNLDSYRNRSQPTFPFHDEISPEPLIYPLTWEAHSGLLEDRTYN